MTSPRLRALFWPLRVERDIQCGFDLRQAIPDWPTPEGFVIRPGTPDEVMELATQRRQATGEQLYAEYESRLGRGQLCFVALRAGAIAGGDWITFRFDHEGPVRIALHDDEVLCMDAFVVPSARGRGLHTAVHRAMLVWAKDKGFRMAYTFLRLGDPAAAKAIRVMGWEHDGKARYTIISSPMLRQFGIRSQLVLDHDPGRHPVPRGGWLRRPPFEREPWET